MSAFGSSPAAIRTEQPSPPPKQTASVKKLASGCEKEDEDRPLMQQRLLDCVMKCLELASHLNTTESEAKAAWCMASRVMVQYNVTQSERLNEVQGEAEHAASGGESVVAITKCEGDTSKVISQSWVRKIARAMTILFDCKVYHSSRLRSVEWTFYGIPANTALAATAFENAHNLTLAWAAEQKCRNFKNSYCLGIGSGLIIVAEDEKNKEKQQTQENTNPWTSSQALVRFQEPAQKVVEEYLKVQNIKLRNDGKKGAKASNKRAFEAGVEDSKKMDLKRQRIEDA